MNNNKANKVRTIEELELSIRAYNSLRRANIRTLDELVKLSYKDLMYLMDKKSTDEVRERLESFGLHLAENLDA